MGQITIKKLDIALNHLQLAIDMFLKNQDLLCIITLAGAADEILGQYATRAGEKTMLDLLCSSLKKEHSINMTDKDFKWVYLNKSKNSIKHFDKKDIETIELDPELEALSMLIRAIGNLYSHDNTVTFNTPALMEWIYENRKDLLSQAYNNTNKDKSLI
jgi:hypothetical protein